MSQQNEVQDALEAATPCPACGDLGYIIIGSSAEEGRHITCPECGGSHD